MRAVISAASNARDNSVLVRRPDAAIPTDERRARTFFPAEAEGAVEQTGDEPLEAHRHLIELPAKLRGDPINHLAAYHRLANRRLP